MTQEEYVEYLELQVDPMLKLYFKDWPTESKLYVYIHNIQLAYMAEFKQLLTEMKNERKS